MTDRIGHLHSGVGAVKRMPVLMLACVSALVVLAVAAAPASAVYEHNQHDPAFSVTNCPRITDLAVDESGGYIYVACSPTGLGVNGEESIQRFDFSGHPAPFSAVEPYITGNRITSNPGSEDGSIKGFAPSMRLAVDNSSSPNHGDFFVTSSPDINAFKSTGEYAFPIEQPVETTIPNRLTGLDVGPDGSIYVNSIYPRGRISKYNPQLQEVKRLYTWHDEGGFSSNWLRVDSAGGVWMLEESGSGPFGKPALSKWEGDQFTTELKPKFGSSVEERFKANLSPFVAPNPLLNGVPNEGANPKPAELAGIDVDDSTNEVYVDREDRIESYSPGTALESSYLTAPAFGAGLLSESVAIAVTKDHHVFASTEDNKVVRFGPGDVLPSVHTFNPDINEVGHKGATLRGKIELSGGTPVKDCQLEFGPTTTYGGSVPCTPDATASPPGSYFTEDKEVQAATGEVLNSGQTYHYRYVAENEKGKNFGADRTFVPAFVLKVQTLPADMLTPSSARLNASFDPDGIPTEYKFQYGVTDSYGLETSFEPGGSGSGVVQNSTALTNLPSGKTFHYRVIAKNVNGTTLGEDRTFRVASTPDVSGVRATEVSAKSALLHASINPVGFETKYLFEYGSSSAYGHKAPATLTSIGSGSEPVAVAQKIENLESGVTYHFRVVAENKWGESHADDTTFDFTPPTCPNNHLRQQSRSAYLPDCRAYELVSPGSSGAALLLPSNLAADLETGLNVPYSERSPYITNGGFASSPSRFSFWGAVSTLPETETTVFYKDMYLATRTSAGWVTKFPGYHNKESPDVFGQSRQRCSESMSLCTVDPDSGENFREENTPGVFDANGKFQGRLPTNINAVEASNPKASKFYGGQTLSGDFNHFVFSSNNVAFAPGGVVFEKGQPYSIGSAYDNDISTRTVTIISKLPNGENIPLQGPPPPNSFEGLNGTEQKDIDFPGISPDGSHILMETPAAPAQGRNRFLFMRVNDAMTYDISRGNPVQPIGMTRDGSKVFFTTKAQMPGTGDTDHSSDLYMWEEKGDKLTLISQGAGQGNSDECSATGNWNRVEETEEADCGVLPLTPERAHPRNNFATSVPGQDDQFAEVSGAIYFYSPELLDAAHPGIKNERNLYVFRNGTVRLVGIFDAGTEVTRSQISPDGAHAAFLTNARLTAYDNLKFDEVYTYDADSGIIRCASCNPSGAPPTTNVTVSQGGRFMSNDGRTFFATGDSLVPRDKNGEIIDVYEYVDGRPQLISSGLASNDYTGGSGVLTLFLPAEHTGLEAVSRDGTDVYFSSFDTLVDRDLNGEFVKFYDARTDGGFPEEPPLAPCAAADECHGADSSAPAPPTIASGAELGSGGNAAGNAKAPQTAKKKHKKPKRPKKHRSRAHSRHGNG